MTDEGQARQQQALASIRRMMLAVKKGEMVITGLVVSVPVVEITPDGAEFRQYASSGIETWTITTEPIEPVLFKKQ